MEVLIYINYCFSGIIEKYFYNFCIFSSLSECSNFVNYFEFVKMKIALFKACVFTTMRDDAL